MPTRLLQLEQHASGTASFQLSGPSAAQVAMPEDLEIAIIQQGPTERYLDPRNPDDPWTTAVYRFRPLDPRRQGSAVWLDIDYGVTYHLRAHQAYKLRIRQQGIETDEIFTGPATLRRPSLKPTGWTPPPDPRGPVSVPQAELPPPPPPPPPPPASEPEPVDLSAGLPSDAPASTVVEAPPPAPEPPAPPAPPVAPPPAIRTIDTGGSNRKWLLPALLVLLVAGAGAGYYLWSRRTDNGQIAIAPGPAPAPAQERASTLESVRAFLATGPDAVQARTWAADLAKAGKLLDGQFLLGKYAAEKGDAESARILGAFYDPDSWSKETSPLPSANPIEAARWFKQAAEAGDAEAQYRYAMLLKKGRTDEADGPEQAVAWLRKAADQGHEAAKKALDAP